MEWNTNTAEWFESLYFNSLLLTAALFYILLHNNLQGKLPNTIIQWLYSAQARGEITFTLTYLLQLRLCFGGLPYQLRIHFVPGSVPFEESEKHPCVQEMLFSHRNKHRILSWTSRLQECSALVESLICNHFSTFLIPCSLQLVHFIYFSGLLTYFLLYIEIEYKVTWSQQTWPLSKSSASYKCIEKVLGGFTSSFDHEACLHFMTFSFW